MCIVQSTCILIGNFYNIHDIDNYHLVTNIILSPLLQTTRWPNSLVSSIPTPEPCHVACEGTKNITVVTMTIGPLKYINLILIKTQLCTIFIWGALS